MRVRGVDKNNDWLFGNGKQDYREDNFCIMQNVKTRLQCFQGNCFYDKLAGLDYWNLFGYSSEEALLSAIRGTILATDGVVGINSVTTELVDRRLVVRYDVKTQFTASYQDEMNLTIPT